MLKKIKHLTLALPLAVGALSVQAKPLSLERIFDDPSLSGKAPVQLKFSPDGSRVTYLQGKTQKTSLMRKKHAANANVFLVKVF